MFYMANQKIFLNNNKGNIILNPGDVYEVVFKAEGRWPELRTILRFVDRYMTGYCFDILDPEHALQYQEAHGFRNNQITYDRDSLRSAMFKTSPALNVLYGKKN